MAALKHQLLKQSITLDQWDGLWRDQINPEKYSLKNPQQLHDDAAGAFGHVRAIKKKGCTKAWVVKVFNEQQRTVSSELDVEIRVLQQLSSLQGQVLPQVDDIVYSPTTGLHGIVLEYLTDMPRPQNVDQLYLYVGALMKSVLCVTKRGLYPADMHPVCVPLCIPLHSRSTVGNTSIYYRDK